MRWSEFVARATAYLQRAVLKRGHCLDLRYVRTSVGARRVWYEWEWSHLKTWTAIVSDVSTAGADAFKADIHRCVNGQLEVVLSERNCIL
jgi:hypothetical protein